ncbi:ATP synthase F(1) complex subunit delta, mitochondrial-like [Saccoglossus kowalevskii]|uniref:ATP synthase subunit delta, mitochondrial-like n=1 Tax=Saccoglossus kowalevskii TaxID=10224 RepID=A0ABM0GU21_SACKO|nr:PREDICTED: ATP synthase subunit delta, mitochondrial-like [Saccoglossus kowalevskii]
MSLLRTLSRLPRSLNYFRPIAGVQTVRRYAEEALAPSQMSFTFATPSEVYYNEADVKQVDVPSTTGDFGILAQHVPVLSVLRPGCVVVYDNDGNTEKYFVSSGTITVNDDSSVQLLAEEATPIDQIDRQAAETGLSKAQQDLQSSTTDLAKAEAQISLELHEALLKALEK